MFYRLNTSAILACKRDLCAKRMYIATNNVLTALFFYFLFLAYSGSCMRLVEKKKHKIKNTLSTREYKILCQ